MVLIPQERIHELFDTSRKNHREGRSSWQIDSECLWSYFFVHGDRDFLLAACGPLLTAGFTFYGTLDPEDGDEIRNYYARYDRVESHTPESLSHLSQQLHDFGAAAGVEFDGMDVGAIEGP